MRQIRPFKERDREKEGRERQKTERGKEREKIEIESDRVKRREIERREKL